MGYIFDIADPSAPRVRADTLDRNRSGLTISPKRAFEILMRQDAAQVGNLHWRGNNPNKFGTPGLPEFSFAVVRRAHGQLTGYLAAAIQHSEFSISYSAF